MWNVSWVAKKSRSFLSVVFLGPKLISGAFYHICSGENSCLYICSLCFQSGFNLVMTHPCCVNEITLSLNSRNPRWGRRSARQSVCYLSVSYTPLLCRDRTKALVLELLAAVCLVRGGHDIILSAFDNFKEVTLWFLLEISHFDVIIWLLAV